LLIQRLAPDSRAARALDEARRDLVRGDDPRHGCVGRDAHTLKPVRRAECAALRLVPAAPNSLFNGQNSAEPHE